MTAAVGSRDDVEDWLNTRALQLAQLKATGGEAPPTPPWGSDRPFPKRSDLRRAEARTPQRTISDRGPAGSRPGAGSHGSSRPNAPTAGARTPEAPRRRSPNAPHLPVALAPNPAVLPLPHETRTRPAGVSLRVPPVQAPNAFERSVPADPTVPLVVRSPYAPAELAAPVTSGISPAEWGLTEDEVRATRRRGADPQAPPTRRGGRLAAVRGRANAARMLVLALVVGAEGIAITSLTGVGQPSAPSVSLPADATAAMSLTAALPASAVLSDAATRQTSAQDATAQADDLAQAQTDSADNKVAAALDQAQAAADRVREAAERRARAMLNAQSDPRAVARLLLSERGWTSQFGCLDRLWTKESQWNYQATNSSSGAYGIPQALPASKMASEGADYRTNPVTQMKWGLNYIADRYGTPCAAWGHSQSVGWY